MPLDLMPATEPVTKVTGVLDAELATGEYGFLDTHRARRRGMIKLYLVADNTFSREVRIRDLPSSTRTMIIVKAAS